MKKRLNNKGFSLIELIVVIAIMVVLIGVTSTVILKYMDHTKYGKDMTALDTVHTAIKLYVADPDSKLPASTEEVQLKTLITGSGDDVYDPNGIIISTIEESFDIQMSGDTVVSCTFVGDSNIFKDINWEDIYVNINEGAVSIVVPVNEEYDNYGAYVAGKYTWSDEQKVKN